MTRISRRKQQTFVNPAGHVFLAKFRTGRNDFDRKKHGMEDVENNLASETVLERKKFEIPFDERNSFSQF